MPVVFAERPSVAPDAMVVLASDVIDAGKISLPALTFVSPV
jgi:hypothetical protein